ncbi:lysophospholipid acyltransferase family protein [Chamaesiphon sp. VAR_48_metabat_135_sub]|uniref:lysophospholipid acyltransferase family protein n=1 Tax=Chamaesiphon sp. VAR_48_metabat_135_sub TaxID=2964699 RepID=UPI0037BE45F0
MIDPPTPNPDHQYDGWSLDDRDPQAIREIFMPMWEWLYHYYFQVTTDGWDRVPDRGRMLVVGSHNGGLASPDMFMLMYDWFCRYGVERPAYGLAHPGVWKYFGPISTLAAQAGAVVAHPKMAMAALQRDAAVLVYPGGAEDVFRPHSERHRIELAGRKGFIKVALREHAPIVPVVSLGAHDGLIVLTDLYPILQQLRDRGMPWLFGIDPIVFPVYLGLPWGIAFGPLPNLPLPTRIHIRICKPIEFSRYGRSAANDRDYVDACYTLVEQQMQAELDLLVLEKKQ